MDSNNNNKRNNRRSTYRSFFIKPYTSEKKERRKNHHNAIIEILKKWTDIKFELVKQKDSLYTTSIPLYVDIINRIESLDEYNEARSHLENKKYSKLLSHYNNIKKIQNNYNKKVSVFMQTTETRIKNEISNNQDLFFKDVNFLKTRFKDQHTIKEALEKGELTLQDIHVAQLGALDDSVGIYYDNFFEHLFKQAINPKENILKIDGDISERGWNFQILFRSDSREKIIAKGIPTSFQRVKNLKNYMENQLEKILRQFQNFNTEINKMKIEFEEFHRGILDIIHDYDSLGLRGNCRVEHELDLLKRVINKIKM